MGRIDDAVRLSGVPVVETKPDGSPVTALDLALSELIEEAHGLHYPGTVFYSEENFSNWNFPLMVLDPLDGTREYVDGRTDWAISVGLFTSREFQGEGWIYGPGTKELYTEAPAISFQKKNTYRGEVSRQEWKMGLYQDSQSEKFKVEPLGSIAYKLGRLSHGKCDFVVSLRPKNIWDIAGGTNLCRQAGINFYSQGSLVTKVEKAYEPPLIWCHEELFSELSAIFH